VLTQDERSASHGYRPVPFNAEEVFRPFSPQTMETASNGRDFTIHKRNALTWVTVHSQLAVCFADAVANVVPDRLLDCLTNRCAALLGRGESIVGLDVLLGLSSRIGTCSSTSDGGNLLAAATTDLVAENAADHGPSGRAGDSMLVPGF
jgi:hypothetical protein